jgi:hypothetical protein
MLSGDEFYPDDVTSGTDEDEDCDHEEVDNVLGFGGDPAREDPRRGTCVRCHVSLHMEPDEDGAFYWEID